MKALKTLAVLFFAAIAISSCTKEPGASFTVSSKVVSTNENVKFTNTSTDADHYSWDFGDGTKSTDENPTHAYSKEGSYTITLTAYSKNDKKSNTYSESITVADTKATITALDDNGYPVSGLPVTLYTTYTDWKNGENPLWGDVIGLTDESGEIIITGLDPITYYVKLDGVDYSNVNIGLDDESWVKIGPLQAHKNNEYTLFVTETDTSK